MLETHSGIVGLAAGICTSISLLPQLIKLVRNKKAEDISLFYLVILFIGLGLWIWYGALREDLPILVTNGFSLIVNGVVIFLGIRYKKAQRKKRENDSGGQPVEFELVVCMFFDEIASQICEGV